MRLFISSFIAGTALLFFTSASAAPITGPEYVGVFEALVGGEELPLEQQKTQGQMRVRFGGLGGGSGVYFFNGARSPVRFARGSELELIVRVSTQENDPQSLFTISRLDSRQDRRELVAMKVNALGLGGKSTLEAAVVPFIARKYGQEFFVLKPVEPLEAGEYVVGVKTSDRGFLFGVD